MYCVVVIFVKIDALAAVFNLGSAWISARNFRFDLNQPNVTSHKHITPFCSMPIQLYLVDFIPRPDVN
jgi:hypothetical protein